MIPLSLKIAALSLALVRWTEKSWLSEHEPTLSSLHLHRVVASQHSSGIEEPFAGSLGDLLLSNDEAA